MRSVVAAITFLTLLPLVHANGPAKPLAITAPMWEDRVLGLTQMVRVPVRCVWVATGNNPPALDGARTADGTHPP